MTTKLSQDALKMSLALSVRSVVISTHVSSPIIDTIALSKAEQFLIISIGCHSGKPTRKSLSRRTTSTAIVPPAQSLAVIVGLWWNSRTINQCS